MMKELNNLECINCNEKKLFEKKDSRGDSFILCSNCNTKYKIDIRIKFGDGCPKVSGILEKLEDENNE